MNWQSRSPNVRAPFDWYFKPPPELEGGARSAYQLLTVASLPLVVCAFISFYMFKARFRRRGVTGFFAVYSHFLGSVFVMSILYALGSMVGINGYLVGVPLTGLLWVPLAARYALLHVTRGGAGGAE